MSDTVVLPQVFDWGALRVERDGETVVVPCLSFTLWLDVTEAPLLIDFYERVMEALGSLFTHYVAESMKGPAKITSRALTMIPTWIRKPAELKVYTGELRGGADIDPASLKVVFRAKAPLTPAQEEAYRRNLPRLVQQGLTVTTGLPASVFRVTLPLSHPLASPDKLARWVLGFEAVRRGQFVSGGCDFAVNHDATKGDTVEKEAWALCARYPGLDWYGSVVGLWLRRYEPSLGALLPLVKRAGWITLVSESAVEFLGGQARLDEALARDPAVAVERLDHGVAIRSGEAPRLGEMAHADIPYRAVAAAVRPVRLERVHGLSAAREEWIEGWLAQLDTPVPGQAR
jgi:hypothetical protein